MRTSTLPTFPEFKHLELHDKKQVEQFTKPFPPYSDFHFTSMWCWDIKKQIQLSILNNNLVVRFSDYLTGEPFYSFIGSNAINETAKALFAFLHTINGVSNLKLIPEIVAKQLDAKCFIVKEDRDNFDYVYDVKKMNGFNGKDYSQQRQHINQFNKKFNGIIMEEIEVTNSTMQEKVLCLFSTWAENKNKTVEHFEIINEYSALKKLLGSATHFSSLKGLGFFHHQELIGFSIHEFINEDYAITNFIKSNIKFHGSFSFLMKEKIRNLQLHECKYLNYEQDLGLESLRFSKMNFRPVLFLKKYIVEPIENALV